MGADIVIVFDSGNPLQTGGEPDNMELIIREDVLWKTHRGMITGNMLAILLKERRYVWGAIEFTWLSVYF